LHKYPAYSVAFLKKTGRIIKVFFCVFLEGVTLITKTKRGLCERHNSFRPI